MNDPSFALPAGIDFDSLAAVRGAGEEHIASADGTAVFDLSGLAEANSAAVALLMSWYRYGHKCGKAIVYTRASSELRNIVRVSGLESILPFAVPDEAVAPDEAPLQTAAD